MELSFDMQRKHILEGQLFRLGKKSCYEIRGRNHPSDMR